MGSWRIDCFSSIYIKLVPLLKRLLAIHRLENSHEPMKRVFSVRLTRVFAVLKRIRSIFVKSKKKHGILELNSIFVLLRDTRVYSKFHKSMASSSLDAMSLKTVWQHTHIDIEWYRKPQQNYKYHMTRATNHTVGMKPSRFICIFFMANHKFFTDKMPFHLTKNRRKRWSRKWNSITINECKDGLFWRRRSAVTHRVFYWAKWFNWWNSVKRY